MTDADWIGFIALGIIALIVDATIPAKPGRWAGPASAQDVATIVRGGKPKSRERDGLKLALLLGGVLILFVVFFGG